MAYSPSTYVVVYDKKTGEGTKIYRATLPEFMATGNYTTEPPANAHAGEKLAQERKPSAGREATRANPAEVYPGVPAPKEGDKKDAEAPKEEAKPEVKEAPAKPAPKRRAAPKSEAE